MNVLIKVKAKNDFVIFLTKSSLQFFRDAL